MRAAVVLLLSLWVASSVQAQKYSVRDVGFTDLETKPYRLILLAPNPAAPAVTKLEAEIKKQIEGAPIKLAVHAANMPPAILREIQLPKKFVGPQLLVVAPDDTVKFVGGANELPALLASPLRDSLLERMTHSLAVIVFLHSQNPKDDEQARALAEKARTQINEVRSRFGEKSPDHDVEMITVNAEDAKKEPWVLWALGETDVPPAKSKVYVLYGKMRRAGKPLEGSDWKEDDLFARLAILAQPWDGDAREIAWGPVLPFVWTGWPGEHGKELGFDPVKDADEIKKVLDQPPVQAPPARKLRYADWTEPDDPHHIVPVNPPLVESPKYAEPWVSSTPVGIVLLIAGLLGWIALGLGAWSLAPQLDARMGPKPSP
jgi:hypothetical protein